jgi:hypothetical protein
MTIKHTTQTTKTNNPNYDVSADAWNAAHTIDPGTIVNADINAAAAIAQSKLAAINVGGLSGELADDQPPYLSTTHIGATAYVGLSADYATLAAEFANVWYCDGTADDVQINAAITYVGGLGGGDVLLEKGSYAISAKLVHKQDTHLRGASLFETILVLDNGVDDHVIDCSDVWGWQISNLTIDGNKANQASGCGVYIYCTAGMGAPTYFDYMSRMEDVFIWECKDDGVFGDGDVDFMGSQFHRVTVYECDESGFEWAASDVVFSDCIAGNNLAEGFFIKSTSGQYVNCKSFGSGTGGGAGTADVANFRIYGNENVLVGCHAEDGQGDGFWIDGDTLGDRNLLVGCHARRNGQNNTSAGFRVSGGTVANLIISDCYSGDDQGVETQDYGFEFDATTTGVIIDGGVVFGHVSHGLHVNGSDGVSIRGLHINNNGGYGINIAAGSANTRLDGGNVFSGNTSGAIANASSTTIFPSFSMPFIAGTTRLDTAGAAWGYEIDANAEYAVANQRIPDYVQQVVQLKIQANSIVVEADAMRLEIAGQGGGDNEAYNAETIAIADKASTSTNFAANDQIYWTLTASDDADIDDFVGGDLIAIKVLHEAAGGADCATDAVFVDVLVEYV